MRTQPTISHRHTFTGAPISLIAVLTVLATFALVSCTSTNDLLTVSSPSRIPAASLEDPADAPILVNGAVGDFECAFGAYVVLGGLIGDELDDATQTADRFPYDQRNMQSKDTRYATAACTGLGVYTPLQTARVSADNVRRLLSGWTDQQVANRRTLLATAEVYEAYSMLLLGEGFCSTTFSTFDASGNVQYNPEIQPAQVYAQAETMFTTALADAQAANAPSLVNLALIGRARSRLDQGHLADARADAAQVPPAFAYSVTASATITRRNNRMWAENNSLAISSSVGAYYHNLNDPRVPVSDAHKKSVTGVSLWQQTKYPLVSSPIRFASGDEAQLIVAEADITTNPTEALTILNAFRAKGNEPALVPGSTTADMLKAAVIEERRRALFLEGYHLGDFIRYNLPLNPPPGAAYPGGGTYGANRCLPLPDVERLNNPLLNH
ncbi:MAG: RagB/SusD family nutrient uptake outer membrane protein [Gemmatimonadaceae bacterium]